MPADELLRRVTDGYAHWCPGCGELHTIPNVGWTFNGDRVRPSFRPSVRITSKKKIIVDGKWTGRWEYGLDGKALDHCCHYTLTWGQIFFHGDSTHALADKTVPLPPLPTGYID